MCLSVDESINSLCVHMVGICWWCAVHVFAFLSIELIANSSKQRFSKNMHTAFTVFIRFMELQPYEIQVNDENGLFIISASFDLIEMHISEDISIYQRRALSLFDDNNSAHCLPNLVEVVFRYFFLFLILSAKYIDQQRKNGVYSMFCLKNTF